MVEVQNLCVLASSVLVFRHTCRCYVVFALANIRPSFVYVFGILLCVLICPAPRHNDINGPIGALTIRRLLINRGFQRRGCVCRSAYLLATLGRARARRVYLGEHRARSLAVYFARPCCAALQVSHKYRVLGKALAPRLDLLSGDMTTWELYRSLVGSGWRHEVQQKIKARPLIEPRAPS
jgi:hypothetical protein